LGWTSQDSDHSDLATVVSQHLKMHPVLLQRSMHFVKSCQKSFESMFKDATIDPPSHLFAAFVTSVANISFGTLLFLSNKNEKKLLKRQINI